MQQQAVATEYTFDWIPIYHTYFASSQACLTKDEGVNLAKYRTLLLCEMTT